MVGGNKRYFILQANTTDFILPESGKNEPNLVRNFLAHREGKIGLSSSLNYPLFSARLEMFSMSYGKSFIDQASTIKMA